MDAIRGVRAAQDAEAEAADAVAKAWAHLGKVANAPTGNGKDNAFAMNTAESLIAEHAIAERERGNL